ncbi:MAG: orotidine-5'-phosphate decarboxylase [Clostridiaceae bacterium]|nr:orotidine-5'-phosphate decarboxylase [Clostridiaceae bacterium]
MFIDRLLERIIKKRNPAVIGLDPLIEYVSPSIREKYSLIYGNTLKACAEAILEFNKSLLDAVYDIIPAVKPQSAYYEMYGSEGIRTLIETIRYAKEKGFIVIVDAKRNDIGSTATAYSSAYLGKTVIDENISQPVFDADALTVNGYLGIDGIKPMLECCDKYGKGIFVLVKTSNPSSVQLQDIVTDDGRRVYEVMADLVHDWGTGLVGKHGYSSAGAVVGATWPEQLKSLRKRMPHTFFLVPGYGAQGGSAADVAAAFDSNGLGAVINASRSLMCAYKHERWRDLFTHEQFADACREEALRMKKEFESFI